MSSENYLIGPWYMSLPCKKISASSDIGSGEGASAISFAWKAIG